MHLQNSIAFGLLWASFAQGSSLHHVASSRSADRSDVTVFLPTSLDVTNAKQLQKAASQALKNLMTYYTPTWEGVFNQAETPWFESGIIWNMHFDYAKWTGDRQFLDLVTAALVNTSHHTAHDFYGDKGDTLNDTLEGHWNDDGLWQALAAASGADVLGPHTEMPGAKADWISLAVKTFDQVGAQMDEKCGGGIYWYRDRNSSRGGYKSLITNLQFIALGARINIITKNTTYLHEAEKILTWVTTSGLANPRTGVLLDGVNVGACGKYTKDQWTYNYGQLIGALAWMHKATGKQEYLDLAVPYFEHAVRIFAGPKTLGVVAEMCEAAKSCKRDQQAFKAVLVRNLAYMYRQTKNVNMKKSIQKIIDTSLKAMVKRSCDQDWNCSGNWTQDTHPVKYVRSQHVSTALLIAALGVHHK